MGGNYVIAGGSGGIGAELVRRIAVTADQVFVYSRTRGGELDSENVTHIKADFTDDEFDATGIPESISGVVYCPGSINLRSFRSLKLSDFRSDMEVNLIGAVRFLQACAPGLKQGGKEEPSSVVMFSTVAVHQGMPMHASVAASKGAVEGLTRSLAAEWAPHIRVNCVAPALTETPLSARFFATEESRKAMSAKYPMGRTGTVQDLASIAEFLVGPQSSWITGQVIGVDGGLSSLRAK